LVSAEILSSPGELFSNAALACVHKVTFEPARDASGRSIAGFSRPVTVRFERWQLGVSGR
jgi:hypothetical protein